MAQCRQNSESAESATARRAVAWEASAENAARRVARAPYGAQEPTFMRPPCLDCLGRIRGHESTISRP